jgi:hypothetical protein
MQETVKGLIGIVHVNDRTSGLFAEAQAKSTSQRPPIRNLGLPV